jgi:neutral trehalase
MKDLNQVQKALEAKANNEVIQIVKNFIKEVDQMNDKYNGFRMFYLRSLDENKRMFVDIDDFQKIITDALIERHKESIVEYKTKELLNKLELI